MKKFIACLLSLIILMSSFSVCSSAVDYEQLEKDRSFKNYKDLLYDIYYEPYKYVEGPSVSSNDYFTIADINGDGIDDLIVRFIGHAMAFQYIGVWTFDRSIKRVKLLDTFGAYTEFYSTGYAKQNWSHNQMMSWPIWPYTLACTDGSDDQTINVEAYKSGESYYREEYEALEDADNDGIVYVVEYDNNSVLIPLTYSEFRAFEDEYIPSNKLIFNEYDYMSISEYSIGNLEADYGSDLPANGTMTGDINGDNKITAADARSTLRFAANIDIPNDRQRSLADVDANGKITAADARKILRVAAKIDSGFGTAVMPDFIYDRKSYNGVRVADASDVLEYFNDHIFYAAETEYASDIIFYTDENITDFCFLDLEIDWDNFPLNEYREVKVNKSFSGLSKDCPIVIRMSMPEIVPFHGISFKDEDGVVHKYSISVSGEDGSVYMSELQ